MFYEPDKNNHGLRFAPFKSCVVPRPIGWISTLSRLGLPNLAPYSQFNIVGFEPTRLEGLWLAFTSDDRRKP